MSKSNKPSFKKRCIRFARLHLDHVLIKIRQNKLLTGALLWFGFMWSWSMQTDAMDLAGNKKQGLVIAGIVLAINILISLAILRQAIKMADKLVNLIGVAKAVILLVPLFALTDYLVGWLMALFWVGPQAQLDSILPIGSVSFAVLRTPFIFAGRLIGFFGIAGFVWTAAYLIVKKDTRKLALLPVAGLAAMALISAVLFSSNSKPQYRATLVSETLTERVPTIRPTDQKLVLFPEYGLEKATNANIHERITKDKTLPKTYFAGSTQVYKQGRMGHENRLLFGNTQEGITRAQDKYRLIPGGEDAPYLVRIGLRATGQVGTLNYFSYAKAVIKGKQQLKNQNVGDGVVMGLAVCSSIIAPQDYRHFTKSGATVLANSASLKPFGGSRLFAWIQQSMGRFMAVSNNRYFLQSANSASTYAYDNNGKLLGQKYGITTLDARFASIRSRTLYTLVGEWMIWLGAAVVLAITMHTRRNRKKT